MLICYDIKCKLLGSIFKLLVDGGVLTLNFCILNKKKEIVKHCWIFRCGKCAVNAQLK